MIKRFRAGGGADLGGGCREYFGERQRNAGRLLDQAAKNNGDAFARPAIVFRRRCGGRSDKLGEKKTRDETVRALLTARTSKIPCAIHQCWWWKATVLDHRMKLWKSCWRRGAQWWNAGPRLVWLTPGERQAAAVALAARRLGREHGVGVSRKGAGGKTWQKSLRADFELAHLKTGD